jgi:hypothetical protein
VPVPVLMEPEPDLVSYPTKKMDYKSKKLKMRSQLSGKQCCF